MARVDRARPSAPRTCLGVSATGRTFWRTAGKLRRDRRYIVPALPRDLHHAYSGRGLGYPGRVARGLHQDLRPADRARRNFPFLQLTPRDLLVDRRDAPNGHGKIDPAKT